jgi:multidrug efflux system outer membrane protein
MVRTAILAVAVSLTGCAMGPDYERPDTTPIAAAWRDSLQSIQDSSFANLAWWEVLGDSTLQELVKVGLRYNRDLRLALARVNEARARAGIQRLEALPQIDVGATAGIRQIGDSLAAFSGDRQGQYDYFRVGASVSWEIDLWGRLRRLDESSRAQLLSTEYGRRAVIITVVSDVAVAYLELRDLDAQTAIATRTVETRQVSLDLARLRFEGGLTSELDVAQGEAELARAESQLARLERQVAQKENEVSVLVGMLPGAVGRGLPLDQQDFPSSVPPGLPSALLERRPDVREAEERLHAANARIGAAIAAQFPTISLTGTAGSISDDVGDLFQTGTGFWNLAVNLFQPILNSGRSKKQVELERARTEGAVAQYEAAVLTAFREVEDALVAVRQLQIQVEASGRQVEAARRAVELAGDRYQGGVDSYLTLLDAQRVLFDAELDESGLQRQQRVSMVQLYKALGGGWDTVTDSLALPPASSPPEEAE